MVYKYYDRYSEETKNRAVEDILYGGLLLEEVMLKYKILSRNTVIRWLKAYKKNGGSVGGGR